MGVCGKKDRNVDGEKLHSLMVMYMKAILPKINLMDLGLFPSRMVVDMKVTSKIVNNMELEPMPLLTDRPIEDSGRMEKNMVVEPIALKTLHTMVIGKMGKCMEEATLCSQMEVNTKGSSR